MTLPDDNKPKSVASSGAWDEVLYSENDIYISELYSRYLSDSSSVDSSWQKFFEGFGIDDFVEGKVLEKEMHGATWSPGLGHVLGNSPDKPFSDSFTTNGDSVLTLRELMERISGRGGGGTEVRQATLDTVRALLLIRSYRMRGHLDAKLDPLELSGGGQSSDLDPSSYGFSPKDYDRPIFINHAFGLETATLSQIIDLCRKTYSSQVGVEFAHIMEPSERVWIRGRVENTLNRSEFSDLGKKTILARLTEADIFESFLHKKFGTFKRFGLDGGESLVPMIEQICKRGTVLGIEDIVIGMAHRGRLNLLANIMHKPYREIFAEFKGGTFIHDGLGSGDVKYHLGASADRVFDGARVHLSLTANPSHLECVNTVVLGKVRAKQDTRGDRSRDRALGVLLHGDAAFIGQGVVAETFLLSELKGYTTGGTIHIAINNQIGFTTMPRESRSSPYCSDMAKTIGAPVFHVNGDNPEACVHVARLAMEYRQKFNKDVVIDMWCYRRHGHNESDEPMFTQPLMYRKIGSHPKVRDVYARNLEQEGVIARGEAERLADHYRDLLEKEFAASDNYRPNTVDWMGGDWQGMSFRRDSGINSKGEEKVKTGVSKTAYRKVAKALTSFPSEFVLHKSLLRQMKRREENLKKGVDIDWGAAESLAFGTLLIEGHTVRLSGEDSRRGTFSQRHAVVIDQENESTYIALNHIDSKKQARIEIIDSPLSEFGLLGFEYGYALAYPSSLVLWEAQFGDFANGAQVIIDQFIASGESKWLRMCGLVMLLPHGYEGQGPEHSSARLERYLQLSAEDNWSVCNLTTPANYFHVLRRQILRNFRKPLIIMTPKSLLRNPLCVSRSEDFIGDAYFRPVLPDSEQDSLMKNKDIRRVIICSGKVYYDLIKERKQREIKDIYILRIEELYPWPEYCIKQELKKLGKVEVVWCQEEPENGGGWSYVDRKLRIICQDLGLEEASYVGRVAVASPASGSSVIHEEQQQKLINEALSFVN